MDQKAHEMQQPPNVESDSSTSNTAKLFQAWRDGELMDALQELRKAVSSSGETTPKA